MDASSAGEIAQFAGIDPRTAGKLVKNALEIGIIDQVGSGYGLNFPYPYKGTLDQKKSVVREALVRLPLLINVRQFLLLGDKLDVAMRKAATLARVKPYDASEFAPLLSWAESLGALKPSLIAEDLVVAAESEKSERHRSESKRRVAFLSHSSRDKPFARQLAADLASNGVEVWLDEQRIRVGESIPEKVAQGLAESDYFLIVISKNSIESEWVKKELNSALVEEVRRRRTHILPIKIDNVQVPTIIHDKKYADFSSSYKVGLADLVAAMQEDDLDV